MPLKRVPLIEDRLAAGGTHPDAVKPLSDFKSIAATCSDCGHTRTLDRERLDELTAVATFGDLWRMAFCAQCREDGSLERNVVLRGEPHDTPYEMREPIYEKERREPVVFGSKRTDPYPNLPRARIGCDI